MSGVNLTKLVKKWFAQATEDSTDNIVLRDDDINLDLLKPKVKPQTLQWTPIGSNPESASLTRTVTLAKNPNVSNVAEAVGQVHVSKDSEIIGRVTLHTGVIKGINRMVKLPLTNSAVRRFLGESVEINLGQAVTEIKKDKMTISVSLEVSGEGATAKVGAKKIEYKEHFKCDVAISGHVIIDDNGEISQQWIHEIIRDLQSEQDLHTLTVDHRQKEVVIPLEGELEFLWDYEQSMEWSDAVHS